MNLQTKLIDSQSTGKRILLIAGVHGDEFEPIYVASQLIEELSGRLVNGQVEIVTIANKAAYKMGDRFGEDGLDMARVCPGDAEGKPTEVVAYEVSERVKDCDFLIDMHTGGLAYDIFPMVGYMLHSHPDILEKQQQMAIASGLPLIWGTDHRPNGRTLSVARDAGKPALYFEYGGGNGFRRKVVVQYQQAVVNVLSYLGMLNPADHMLSTDYMYWVEDYRTDSGHFQVKMPSPIDGIFMASVSVGDRVSVGDCIGKVFDPLTGEQEEINANIEGIVHFLRVMVRVNQGDALGGILPATLKQKEVIYA